MKRFAGWLVALFCVCQIWACTSASSSAPKIELDIPTPTEKKPISIPPCDGFDFPVGPPDAKGYYNAQVFTRNEHLGDDWNGNGGGNSDFGDPVYAIADGLVKESVDYAGGWGNVIRILHCVQAGDGKFYVESLYAHLDTMQVEAGDTIKRGQQIGRIGDAGGAYWAHLHLEIRTDTSLGLGGGYSGDTTGYTNPTAFIRAHRPR